MAGRHATEEYANNLGTSSPTPNTIMRRDGDGRVRAASPDHDDDLVPLHHLRDYVDDQGAREDYLPYRMAAGMVEYTTPGGGNIETFFVAFPSGRFTKPPVVTLSWVDNYQSSIARVAFISGTTGGTDTDGFTCRVMQDVGSAGATRAVHWQAVQMDP